MSMIPDDERSPSREAPAPQNSAPAGVGEEAAERLFAAVVSPASLGAQAAHEVETAVAGVAEVVRVRSLAELFARVQPGHSSPIGTVALIIATDEVGSLDDVASAVAHYPAVASARLVLITERRELSDVGRAIDEDLVQELLAVPWTPGTVGTRAAAQIRRWMRDHRPDDPRRYQLTRATSQRPVPERSPMLEALSQNTDELTKALIDACEKVLGPRPRLRLQPGVRLTHQGQPVDGVYIVISGAVALTRHTRVGEVTLHHATTGRIVGLVSLASQGRAFVTATTTTECELILLSIEQLDRALRENPATEQNLAALFISSLTKRLSRSEILQVEKIELAAVVESERAATAQALADLEQARLELLAQERFATLGELAAGVAHELNNPVAALERASDHLYRDFASLLDAHAEHELITRTAEAARTRPASSTREERAARKVLERVVGDRDLATKLVSLGFDADSDLAQVEDLASHPERLETALTAASIGRQARNMSIATGRIRGLVSSLSTYMRPEGEMEQDVDLREVMEDSLRLTAHRLRGVSIERDYEPVPLVAGRAGELAQVWTNILSNAADALASASLAAEEAGETFEPRLLIRISSDDRPSGPQVRVDVEDNGPGIAPNVLPRIFEPRFTTRHGQVRFGMGMGMGLAKSVVDSHDGTISVESEPGRTRVGVVIPAAPHAPQQP